MSRLERVNHQVRRGALEWCLVRDKSAREDTQSIGCGIIFLAVIFGAGTYVADWPGADFVRAVAAGVFSLGVGILTVNVAVERRKQLERVPVYQRQLHNVEVQAAVLMSEAAELLLSAASTGSQPDVTAVPNLISKLPIRSGPSRDKLHENLSASISKLVECTQTASIEPESAESFSIFFTEKSEALERLASHIHKAQELIRADEPQLWELLNELLEAVELIRSITGIIRADKKRKVAASSHAFSDFLKLLIKESGKFLNCSLAWRADHNL
jgi:hypothetical protein